MRRAGPMASVTARSRDASPWSVACRNAPGGGVTRAGPKVMMGWARRATVSASQVRRDRPWVSAMRARSMRSWLSAGLPPVTTTSAPDGWRVTVSCISVARVPPSRTMASRAGKVAIRAGSSNWHCGTGSTVSDPRMWNPSSVPARVRRADRAARRRLWAGEVRIGRIGAVSPCPASAPCTMPVFQRATRSSEACCIRQPPQVFAWMQGGLTRSATGVTIRASSTRSPVRVPSTTSPGRVRGTKTGPSGPSAMPSPW